MKEVWIPERRETKRSEKTSTGFLSRLKENPVSQKYAVRAAVLFAIAFPGCSIFDHQEPAPTMTPSPTPAVYQLPSSATFKSSETPTPIPTLTPEPIPTPTPTIIPTATPKPTERPRPTATATPEPPPTKIPVATKTPKPPPTPTKRPEPTPMPTPTPTPIPTPTLAPTPTPTQAPKLEIKPGEVRRFSKCISNTSIDPKQRSIDLESTGGVKGNMKAEIKVPKTPEEIKSETEIARKKAIEEGKDPDKIVIETEKSISEGEVVNNPTGDLCFDIKVRILPGASPDCYEKVIYNLRSREPGNDGALLDQGPLLQNFCIRGTLQGSFDEKYSRYDSTTQPHTVTSIIVIDNPADIPQKTRFVITEPCSFLRVAEQEIQDVATGLRIFPDQPQTIPANKKIWYDVKSTLPFGEKPTSFPLECTVKLERILEE